MVTRRDFLRKTAGVASAAGVLSLAGPAKALNRDARLRAILGVKRVDKPTYQIVGEVERFDSRWTAFSQAVWDESSPNYGYMGNIPSKIPQGMKDRIMAVAKGTTEDGFRHTDIALGDAAKLVWYLGFGFAVTHMWAPALKPGWKPYSCSPEEASQILKIAAKHFGASLVGTTKLNPSWRYTHRYYSEATKRLRALPLVARALALDPAKLADQVDDWAAFQCPPVDEELPPEMNNVIVCGVEQDYDMYRTSPSNITAAAATHAYAKMKYIVMNLAQFINNLGYRAWPWGSGGPVLGIPVAVDAGLGELGRNGLLITPEFGPRVRITGVITDMPLAQDQPIDMGVWQFCQVCKKCAEKCPSGALQTGEPTSHKVYNTTAAGVLKWPVDGVKCLQYWNSVGTICGDCIRNCPFNKPATGIHRLAQKLAPAMGSVWVKMDDLFGYSARIPSDPFWTQDPSEFPKRGLHDE